MLTEYSTQEVFLGDGVLTDGMSGLALPFDNAESLAIVYVVEEPTEPAGILMSYNRVARVTESAHSVQSEVFHLTPDSEAKYDITFGHIDFGDEKFSTNNGPEIMPHRSGKSFLKPEGYSTNRLSINLEDASGFYEFTMQGLLVLDGDSPEDNYFLDNYVGGDTFQGMFDGTMFVRRMLSLFSEHDPRSFGGDELV